MTCDKNLSLDSFLATGDSERENISAEGMFGGYIHTLKAYFKGNVQNESFMGQVI